ncbi:MAG: caspase family protein [Ramlibacter sp.]
MAGCAAVETPPERTEPDLRFAGVIAPGDVRGERSAQVLGAVEAQLLQAFPRAEWQTTKPAQADVALDVTVYSANTSDTRSTQEQRQCRRWSEPDKNAKDSLRRILSTNCVDWQVRQIPCLTRRYELDVQVRVRQPGSSRLVASDRKVAVSTDRKCGEEAPSLAHLQAQAEREVAAWTVRLLKPSLAELVPSRFATLPAAQPAPAPAPVIASAAPLPAPAPHATTIPGFTRVQAHALVIGNANYPGSARLANPINDARAIERKLSDLGFRVTRIDDGDRDTLVRGLSQFQQKAAASEVTVLYYSGHGMQLDGVNYLMPVNIDINKPATLKLQALPIDTIIDTYLPGRTRVVFLDACRDNPVMTSSLRGFRRGLAPMQVPTGTLIAYATRDGGVAEDGAGMHSPFTQAILDLIAEPEDISLVLRRVRDRVMQQTGGRQQPWEYGSLSGGSLVFSRLVGQ